MKKQTNGKVELIVMSDSKKTIHEFFYNVGSNKFLSHYNIIVDRETEKMLYGAVFDDEGNSYSRCSINKSNLNKICSFVDRNRGTIYRIQLDENDRKVAYNNAKNIIYNYLLKIAENFNNHKEEN